LSNKIIGERQPIGKYYSTYNGGIIQLKAENDASAEVVRKSLKNIKESAFLRVLLWFDRFDDKRCRSHLLILQLMPYEEVDISNMIVPEWVAHWTD
jgi:hypothetical protein